MLRLSALTLAALAATSTVAIAQTTTPPTGAPTAPTATTAPAATAQPSTMAAPAATATAPNPKVGGAEMLATKTIVENASAAPSLSTLVTAVKAADLAETLSGAGPFTVFAPENDAFTRLAPGTLDTLMKPENKAVLAKVLTYHVVPGKVSLAQLQEQMKAGGGTATLTTVEGSPLTVTTEGAAIVLTDVSGNKSYVAIPDVNQSNGVVHIVNGVVVPKLG
ncbi:fasciclin domain-containing protein [Sphingomonas qomolangmaensis]